MGAALRARLGSSTARASDPSMDSQADRGQREVQPAWAIASILLLGVLLALCAKCRKSNGVKEDGTFRKSRRLNTNPPQFQIVRAHTLVRPEQLQGQDDNTPAGNALKPKRREGCNEEPRYQNMFTGQEQAEDGAYVIPISVNYYNSGNFLRPPTGEEDSHSYVNVLIPATEGSDSGGSESDYTDPDYVNATLPRRQSNVK